MEVHIGLQQSIIPKIIHKQRGRLISPPKILSTQQRIRNNFERRLRTRLIATFRKIGNYVATDISNGQRTPISLDIKLERDIGDTMVEHYRIVIDAFSSRFLNTFQTKQEMNRFERVIQRFILLHGAQQITRISETTKKQIAQIIRNNALEGLAIDIIAKNVREFMQGNFTKYRATMIARTETHNAASYANHAIARDMNVPAMKKRWISTADGRTRSFHSALNGVTVDMEEDFVVNVNGIEYYMSYPSDPRGGAINNINCRCVLAYVTEDDNIV